MVSISINTSDAYSTLHSFYSKQDLLWSVSSISRFHRIQGSNGLEEAVDFVVKNLLDLKNFEVKLHRFSYSERYGIHHDIVGWDVVDGFTYIVRPKRETLSRFMESRTAVVAHSPRGDVEAEVIYVGNGLDLDRYRGANGKIVLSYGSPYIVYRIGCRFGASGFIFFKRDAYETAVPYVGLFLCRGDVEACRAPATTVSRASALNIVSSLEKGYKVIARTYVESRFRAEASIPVLELSLGDGESEIHAYAHVCHPAGTVNDNVSGSAALVELAKAIDRAVDRGKLRYPRYRRVVFTLFPEYYGSLPYLLEKTKSISIEFGVNLDMIGEKQWLTNSTLYFIRPPAILSNGFTEGIFLKTLLYGISKASTFSSPTRTTSYRFDIVPYDSGSDHDVYLQFGIPSIMINQWPDTYYHSDMDTADKFDPDIASSIAVAVGVALHTLSSVDVDEATKKMVGEVYTQTVEGYKWLKRDDEATASRDVEGIEDTSVYRNVAPRGVISVRYIYDRLGFEETLKVMNHLENKFMYHLFSRYIPLLLSVKPMNLHEIARYIDQDYGRSLELEDVRKIVGYLHKIGIVEKIE